MPVYIFYYCLIIFQAEARLAARRQARAEARDIRMRELEKQQKDVRDDCEFI